MFLIDGSESISEDSWITMIAFLLNVMDQLRIGPELFRVGIAQFSSTYQKEFYMNEYKDANGVKSAIQRITQIKEGTLIGRALRNVVEFFQEGKGSRKQSGVPQNLVLITDGVSLDRVNEAADDLRNLGINVFAIGIGAVSLQQLSYIAGSPDRLFKVQNFNYLNLTTATFVDALCVPLPLTQASEYMCQCFCVWFELKNIENSLEYNIYEEGLSKEFSVYWCHIGYFSHYLWFLFILGTFGSIKTTIPTTYTTL